MVLGVLLLASLFLGQTKGNYLCVCNYNVEQGVLPYPDVQALPLGYLYEFDCKSIVQVTDLNTQKWRAIAYLGQIAYLEANSNIQETMCPGFISKKDIITTTQSQQQRLSTIPRSTVTTDKYSRYDLSTLRTRMDSTLVPIVTTIYSSTTPWSVFKSSTNATLRAGNTSITTGVPAASISAIQTRNVTNGTHILITTTQSGNHSLTTLETDVTNKYKSTISLPMFYNSTILTKTTKPPVSALYIPTTAVRTPIDLKNISNNTSSTTNINLQHKTTINSTKKCSISTTNEPKPFSSSLSYHPASPVTSATSLPTDVTKIYTLPTTLIPTLPPIIDDIALCPPILLKYTKEDDGALTQYGNKCYEFVPFKLIWTKAELDCRAKGGNLITVQTEEFRNYIYEWIRKFISIPAVWLGVSDRRENGWFEWTSGEKLVSTYWIQESAFTNRYDNCGIMLLDDSSKGGWKAVSCGDTTPNGDKGSQYAFICEYSTLPGVLNSGLIGR